MLTFGETPVSSLFTAVARCNAFACEVGSEFSSNIIRAAVKIRNDIINYREKYIPLHNLILTFDCIGAFTDIFYFLQDWKVLPYFFSLFSVTF